MPNQHPDISAELLAHESFLRRLAADLAGGDADDLVQEVWRRALERPPRHRAQLRGWLARIARNLAANRWRGEARRARREEERAAVSSEPASLEARLERRRELVSALDVLSGPCRETILLRYFEDMTPRAIAARQRVPVATVKTRLRRGLSDLRTALDERHGGDRAVWMSALAGLRAPMGAGSAASNLVWGGVGMAAMMKGAAAAAAALVCVVWVVQRAPEDEPPRAARVAAPTAPAELREPDLASVMQAVGDTDARESVVTEEAPPEAAAASEATELRVILEGVTEAEARLATVTLRSVAGEPWPVDLAGLAERWPCSGRSTRFPLDPFLAALARQGSGPDAIDVHVEHPHRWSASARVSMRTLERARVHDVRVSLERPGFWPEFTLSVLDSETRQHLSGVEIRVAPGPSTALWGRNRASASLADGLTSPIALMGGRQVDDPEARVAGMALASVGDEEPRLVELSHHFEPGRGVAVFVRAPGYASRIIAIDVSKGDRELLLEPAAAIEVRLANAQLERYAALGTRPVLCVYWIRPDNGDQYVRFAEVDEDLLREGFRLDGIAPGGYRVAVELGDGAWNERPVLARRELSGELALVAGETRQLVLSLDEPPLPPERASLGGVVSFPTFGGEEDVRLQLYFQPTQRWKEPDVEFSLADMQTRGGAQPTWSFHADDLPVGMYRVQLMPFLEVRMIELTSAGREDVELLIPELAEVVVETVDGRTGERVPLNEFYFKRTEPLPSQKQNEWHRAETLAPGSFRFWTAPGRTSTWPKGEGRLGYGLAWKRLELRAGLQSVSFELAPSYSMRLEIREDGTPLPVGPQGLRVMRDIRAIGHDGRVTNDGLQSDMHVEVSGPGLYEIDFAGVTGDVYQPLPSRTVEVRDGETTEVIVELRRK